MAYICKQFATRELWQIHCLLQILMHLAGPKLPYRTNTIKRKVLKYRKDSETQNIKPKTLHEKVNICAYMEQ